MQIIFLIVVGVFFWAGGVSADMSSSNFLIRWDTVSTGGSDTSASASYQLRDTVGNTVVGEGESASYLLRDGYRQGVFDQLITFDLFGQTNSSSRAVSTVAGTTIMCSTSGLSVGDFIALIQDQGASQVTAIGQIVSVGVGTITVDELKDAGVAPVIDGTNDRVYRLGSVSASLGELDPARVSTTVIGFNVTADVDNGYVVYVFDDGDLRDGADTIDDVGDGTVTAGAEEYGARSSDTSLATSTFDTADTAFTTSFQDVANESVTSFESRNFLVLKASIDGVTVDGVYEQELSLLVSGNY